eukprot:8450081-Ditylum_brightwellii.AAC.1
MQESGDMGGTVGESGEEEIEEATQGEETQLPPCLVVGEGPGGSTLVDTQHGFNELSRMAMLWTIRHKRPLGA